MLDLDIHFQEDGIAMLWSKLCMEQGDGNNSALEWWRGVFSIPSEHGWLDAAWFNL